jgi:hypothetical protein
MGSDMIKRKQYIENRLVRHRTRLGYKDALVIRRAKMGRGGFGLVDVMLLPVAGPYRLVLAKVKQKNSGDAAGKVVGQALLYYVAALSFGLDGLEIVTAICAEESARCQTCFAGIPSDVIGRSSSSRRLACPSSRPQAQAERSSSDCRLE